MDLEVFSGPPSLRTAAWVLSSGSLVNLVDFSGLLMAAAARQTVPRPSHKPPFTTDLFSPSAGLGSVEMCRRV